MFSLLICRVFNHSFPLFGEDGCVCLMQALPVCYWSMYWTSTFGDTRWAESEAEGTGRIWHHLSHSHSWPGHAGCLVQIRTASFLPSQLRHWLEQPTCASHITSAVSPRTSKVFIRFLPLKAKRNSGLCDELRHLRISPVSNPPTSQILI